VVVSGTRNPEASARASLRRVSLVQSQECGIVANLGRLYLVLRRRYAFWRGWCDAEMALWVARTAEPWRQCDVTASAAEDAARQVATCAAHAQGAPARVSASVLGVDVIGDLRPPHTTTSRDRMRVVRVCRSLVASPRVDERRGGVVFPSPSAVEDSVADEGKRSVPGG
jgi:hypothetical protein